MQLRAPLLTLLFFSVALIALADSVSTQVIVGNATPSVSGTTFNNGSAMVLTENTTATFYATSTVTDSNGCSTINHVTADIYRSGVGASSCDTAGEASNNSCYPRVVCTVVGSTCGGGADTTADYLCTVNLQYYADATDSGTYSAQNWAASVYAGDGVATSSADTGTAELNTLLALNVTASIDYGTLAANTDTGAINSTTTVTNTGNKDMDPEISGTQMTSGGDTLAASYQEYSASVFTYGGGTDLSGTPTGINITLPQGTSGTVPITDTVSWGIGIPPGQPAGTYAGTNTFTAATGL